jgi:hypothetical protein
LNLKLLKQFPYCQFDLSLHQVADIVEYLIDKAAVPAVDRVAVPAVDKAVVQVVDKVADEQALVEPVPIDMVFVVPVDMVPVDMAPVVEIVVPVADKVTELEAVVAEMNLRWLRLAARAHLYLS